MKTRLILVLLTLSAGFIFAQSKEYQETKQEKLAVPSPFEKIISDPGQRELVYQDEFVVAFEPLRKQAPVHLLIVPKKRISTLSDATEDDQATLGRMLLVASQLAKKYGIDQTGYRVSMNTNEDAGQSVFHIHLHLLGGTKLGPMVQTESK